MRKLPRGLHQKPVRPLFQALTTLQSLLRARGPSGLGNRRSSSAVRPSADRRSVRRRRTWRWNRACSASSPKSSPLNRHGWDDMARSLEMGEIVPVEAGCAEKQFCDALQTPRVSPITFEDSAGLVKPRRSAVSDEEDTRRPVRMAWEKHGLVVELRGSSGARCD